MWRRVVVGAIETALLCTITIAWLGSTSVDAGPPLGRVRCGGPALVQYLTGNTGIPGAAIEYRVKVWGPYSVASVACFEVARTHAHFGAALLVPLAFLTIKLGPYRKPLVLDPRPIV